MGAVFAWTRLDVRRRWRPLVVLLLLVTLADGVVLAAVAGARRTDTTVARLQHDITQADVMVLPNQPGFDWDRVRALPSVQTLGMFVLSDGGPQADHLNMDEISGFPAGDLVQNVAIDRPKLISGRLPDPNNPDEIIATPGFIGKYGRVLTIHLPSPAQSAALRKGSGLPDGTKFSGPVKHLRVVGTGVNTFDLGPGGGPTFMPTYGFFRDYVKPYFNYFENARVRLRGGPAAIPTFRKQLAQATGNPNIEVADQRDSVKVIQHAASFTAKGWLLFAIAALLASLVLVGQAVMRFTAAGASDLRTLAALGLDRRQARRAASAAPALALVAGTLAALGVAIALSTLFPTGLARGYEPDPGIRIDVPALGTGAAALALLGLIGVAWAGRVAVRGTTEPAGRPSLIAAAATRLGLPVPVLLGTRFALEPGRGRSRVPVRPALVGAVAGVLGVVGALTFRAGLDATAHNPDLFGQTMHWIGFVAEGAPDPSYAAALAKAATDPDLAVLNDMRVSVLSINGRGTSTFSISPVVGTVPIKSLSGRPPESASDIAIAPTTAAVLHAHVGSVVNVDGHPFTVSGITFVPVDPHNGYTDGAWLTGQAFHEVQPDPAKDKFHEVRFNFKPGVDGAAAVKRLPDALAPGGIGPWDKAFPIEEQTELTSVRVQPLLLGGFLVLLALAAVGHGLATAVRRRRHDVAVLRSLGMTRRQARLTIAVQATVLAAFGLAFGIPLGIAAGRSSWQWLANATPVIYVAPLAAIAIYICIPAAVAVANTLAALPARRAARIRVADVLRAE